MGLTINYNISFKGTAEELYNKLEIVRQKCRDLPFEEVSEIEHIRYSKEDIAFFHSLQDWCSYPNNTAENLAERDKKLKDRGLDIGTMINLVVGYGGRDSYYHMINFGLWPGEGCESMDLNFVKRRIYWRCGGFCKTQYATSFVRCHLLVIKALDLLKQEGFIVEVRDEGDYWKTRDLEALAKSINEYTIMLKQISEGIREAVKDTDMKIEASIDNCENYIKIDET